MYSSQVHNYNDFVHDFVLCTLSREISNLQWILQTNAYKLKATSFFYFLSVHILAWSYITPQSSGLSPINYNNKLFYALNMPYGYFEYAYSWTHTSGLIPKTWRTSCFRFRVYKNGQNRNKLKIWNRVGLTKNRA